MRAPPLRFAPLALAGVLSALPACSRTGAVASPPADGPSVAPAPPSASLSVSVSAPSVASAASSAPDASPASHGSPVLYADAHAALEKRCAPKEAAANNVEMKGQMGAEIECSRVALNAELDRTLLAWKASGDPRYAPAMRAEATWNRYEDAACDLTEDTFWVDFDAGTRDDGTNRSVPWAGCKIGFQDERYYFARALAEGDADDLAAHVRQLATPGARTAGDLVTMRAEAAALVAGVSPAADSGAALAFPRPLDAGERKDLLARIDAVRADIVSLAKDTCAGWPALEGALGGEAACDGSLASYYAAHTSYGAGP